MALLVLFGTVWSACKIAGGGKNDLNFIQAIISVYWVLTLTLVILIHYFTRIRLEYLTVILLISSLCL